MDVYGLDFCLGSQLNLKFVNRQLENPIRDSTLSMLHPSTLG